jgi:hypothetical protein
MRKGFGVSSLASSEKLLMVGLVDLALLLRGCTAFVLCVFDSERGKACGGVR